MLRHHRSIRRRIGPGLALLLALAALAAAPAAALALEPTFAFTGRGWGHGIGMSHYGAKGMAEKGFKYDAILKHYYQGTTVGVVPVTQNVRVAIQASNLPMSSWTLKTPSHPMTLLYGSTSYTIPSSTNVSYTFTPSGSNILVRIDSLHTLTLPSPVSVRDSVSGGLVEVVSATGPWSRASILYRGRVRLVAGTGSDAGKAYIYNDLPMEDYLRGVVPRESPASWHMEALKAQAVAARSYAYRGLRSDRVWDVWCTTASQVYGGWGQHTSAGLVRTEEDRTDTAIAQTAGVMVKYGSSVVQTFFFSTSGGHTENIENVWTASPPQPYFKGVADPYEPNVGRHVWAEVDHVGAAALRTKLLSAGITPPASITDVLITKRGVSGRVMTIVLKGAAGDDKTLTGSDAIRRFKNAFGWGDTWWYATSFRWVNRSGALIDKTTVPYGGTATIRFRVSPAMTGWVDGLVITRDGVVSKTRVYVSNGAGQLTHPNITKPITYRIDASQGTMDRRGRGDYFLSGTLQIVPAPPKTTRVSGEDRYTTAVAVSKAAFPSTASAVVLAGGDAPADALSASSLAGSVSGGAPILLTMPGGLPAATKAEIERLGASKVYVLGAAGVVSDTVLSQLGAMPQFSAAGSVVRIGGSDRYATARLVAQQTRTNLGTAWSSDPRVLIVNGHSLADAVAAAPLAFARKLPVLLGDGATLSQETSAAIKALAPAKALVVGGPGVVTDGVLAEMRSLPSLSGTNAVVRIAAGTDRYDTAAKLATYVTAATGGEGFTWSRPHVASGTAFTDALVAGPLAGKSLGPMLFVTPGGVPASTAAVLGAHKSSVNTVVILGGTGVVSSAAQVGLELAVFQ